MVPSAMPAPRVVVVVEGRELVLGPGALVGRAEGAACRIRDPRVSEGHALLSLRGRRFVLLALRGELGVHGERETDVLLEPGLDVELAEGLLLRVVEIRLPATVLAVEVEGVGVRELCAPVYSLVGPPPDLVAAYRADALALLASDGDAWLLHEGATATPLSAGSRVTAGGVALQVVEVPIDQAGSVGTFRPGHRYEPLQLVARFDTVHVFRKGRDPARLVGRPAQAVSALAEFGCPVEWWRAAEELWRDGSDRDRLRRRWDRVLEQLRLQLREAGLRDDLVVSDGKGLVELLLMPGDRVEVQSA